MRNKDPFEELLHRYRGLIFTLCSRFRHRGLDIDDLIQEASIALWRNRERLLALGSVQQAALTWKIARNAVIDALRRTEDTDSLPEGYDERAEENGLEIGNALEMTEKNVSVRLVRTKERLRKAMGVNS